MVIYLIIAALLFLAVIWYVVFLTDGAFGGLDFRSNRTVINLVISIIKQRHLETGIFYDLGSSRGGFVSKIAKFFPETQITAVDNSGFRILLSKARSFFLKNLTFKKENIFKTDVSSADIVYIYLPQELMPSLQTKLQAELKSGALVVTNKVSFPNWTPQEKHKEVFLYVKI